MALLENTLEPLACEIAEFLVQSGMMGSKVWRGYTKAEGLNVVARPNDETVWYARHSNRRARFDLWGIRAGGPRPQHHRDPPGDHA